MVKKNPGHLYQDVAQFFAADKPRHGFGKIRTDFVQEELIHKGHGCIEKRRIQTSTMLKDYRNWSGVG